jgi:hypothetical protein
MIKAIIFILILLVIVLLSAHSGYASQKVYTEVLIDPCVLSDKPSQKTAPACEQTSNSSKSLSWATKKEVRTYSTKTGDILGKDKMAKL